MSQCECCSKCVTGCECHRPPDYYAREAATELLGSLKEIYTPFCNLVDQINRFHPEGVTAEEYQRFMAMVQRMHAAIGKAEGRL